MFDVVQQMIMSLSNLDAVLDKAEAHLVETGMEADELLKARLAPNMLDFTRQVQIACDTAKLSSARLSGKEAPSFPDEEKSFEELHKRLHKTVDSLKSFTEDDFKDYALTRVTLPYAKDKYILGDNYLHQFALPNFFFHYVTAYDLLRHKGVKIGKSDYLGALSMHSHNAH